MLAVGEEGKGGLLRVIYIPLDFVSNHSTPSDIVSTAEHNSLC